MANTAPDGGADDTEGTARRGSTRLFGRRSSLRTPAEALQPQMAPPPPIKRKRKRRGGILSLASGVLSFILVVALVAVAVLGYARQQFLAAGPLTADKVVFIAPHTASSDIMDQFERDGVIANAFLFNAGRLAYGKHSDIKAGEYLFQAHASAYDVMNALGRPKAQQVSVTLNGQMTTHQLVELVDYSVAPGPLAEDKPLTVAAGAHTSDIVDQLAEAGVVDDVGRFDAVLAAFGKRGKLKPGDYVFKPHMTPFQVMSALVAGPGAQTETPADSLPDRAAFVQRAITLPEGLTSEQIVQRLKDFKDEDGNYLLSGDVHVPREGTLMPDTYFFTRGDSRESILKEMDEEQKKVLNDAWTGRAPDLPIKSALELVTLASIVEKETGKADERARVAGVFVNRLMRHMKLQSDPTIIYGLVGGKGTLGRPILASEIKQSSPYNTYIIDGLPPGPICNPGRAALEAAANPMKSKELYFVADGTGGHAFAETIEDHLKNVARWREIEKDAKDKAPPEADKPAAPKPQQKTEEQGGDATSRIASAVPPPAAPAPREAAAAAAPSDVLALGGYTVKIGPALDGQGWQMPGTDLGEGVSAAAFRDDADDEPLTPGRLGSYPLSPARLADLRARAARWGLDPGKSDKLPPDLLEQEPDRTAEAEPCHTVGLASGVRPKGIDASEGTALDPLRNHTFDLNSSKIVPTEAALLAAIAQASAPKRSAKRSQVFRASDGAGTPARSDDCRRAPVIEAAAAPAPVPAPAARLAWNAGPESARPEADAPAGGRSRSLDASEGTNLDPLLNTTYDLNSPHAVPSKPVPLDGSDKPVRPIEGYVPPVQVAAAAAPHSDPAKPVEVASADPVPVAPADPAKRIEVFDASEGTRLDPLLNKTYDLNSPQVVPTKPRAFDGTDGLERPVPPRPKPVQLASADATSSIPFIPPDPAKKLQPFDAAKGAWIDPLLGKAFGLSPPRAVAAPEQPKAADKPVRAAAASPAPAAQPSAAAVPAWAAAATLAASGVSTQGQSAKPGAAKAPERLASLEPPRADATPAAVAGSGTEPTAAVAPVAGPRPVAPKPPQQPIVARPVSPTPKATAIAALAPAAVPDAVAPARAQVPPAKPLAASRGRAPQPAEASAPAATGVAIEPPRLRPVRVSSIVVSPSAMPRAILPSPPATPLTDWIATSRTAPAGPPPIPLAALPAASAPRVVLASPWQGASEAKPAAEPAAAAPDTAKPASPVAAAPSAEASREPITGAALAAIRPAAPRSRQAAVTTSAATDAGARRGPRRSYDLDKNFDLNSAKVIPDL